MWMEARYVTCHCSRSTVFLAAFPCQNDTGFYSNSMATMTWKRHKGWRIQDNDGMTWFRSGSNGRWPPTEGWSVFKEGMSLPTWWWMSTPSRRCGYLLFLPSANKSSCKTLKEMEPTTPVDSDESFLKEDSHHIMSVEETQGLLGVGSCRKW